MFDNGGFTISDKLELIGSIEGKLRVVKKHHINLEFIKYHRRHYLKDT